MADSITWERLRELAGFRAAKGCAISLYVDLDPSTAPTAADVQARVASLLSEAGPQAAAGDLDRIRAWLESEFDRSGLRGLAVFAAGADDLWLTIGTAEPLGDGVRVSAQLHLAPLVPLAAGGEALVALVGREQGRVLRLRGGELLEIADETEEVPGRHGQGGWSQGRFERHIDEIVGRHLRNVAETLDRCVRALRGVPVVIVGTEETTVEFEAMLSNDARDAVVGRTSAEAHADGAQLLEAVRPLLDEWSATQEGQLVERWREAAATNGRAATGWEATLEAASDGRVDTLLVHAGSGRPAYECPLCGRAQVTNGRCPLDGAAMELREDGIDVAVHKTLENGGAVQVIRDARDLEPVGGLAALLRY